MNAAARSNIRSRVSKALGHKTAVSCPKQVILYRSGATRTLEKSAPQHPSELRELHLIDKCFDLGLGVDYFVKFAVPGEDVD